MKKERIMNVRDIQIEYKISMIFASTALLLSLFSGIIAGIDNTVVVVRAVLSAVTFAGLGFAVMYVFKKFVPEFGEIFRGFGSREEQDSIDVETPESQNDTYDGDATGGGAGAAAYAGSEGFSEFNEGDFPHLKSSTGGTGLEDSLNAQGGGDEFAGGKINPSKGKMGKHIIANESLSKYEPKILAEAVRTMMRKGEE
ncbi:MAG: hypothetical protein CVV44_22170 [Spirochaetae bacterium HGW-Spirochaetae-1]|jgi:hypothetical protein|nr:MAG: hypothetical protein CVV44_22170 [Spirochaetae bacterium HGW-Spirochaetae-1]